jgi:hypothetical protein
MDNRQFGSSEPFSDETEPAGAERYLHPGEDLRICSSDIQIKKFRFEAYLTNRRLFLIDQNDPKPGITAKEIPVGSIIGSYLEDSPSREPVIVISVRTAEDDIRTMKMVFAHNGEERTAEAEEWLHLVAHAASSPGETGIRPASPGPSPAPALSPEARALSDTIVVPKQKPAPPVERQDVRKTPPRKQLSTTVPTPPAVKAQPFPATTPIQFCFHCGKKLPPQANFCPYCGTRVHQTTQNEEHHPPIQSPPQYQGHPEKKEDLEKTETEGKKKGWRLFRR